MTPDMRRVYDLLIEYGKKGGEISEITIAKKPGWLAKKFAVKLNFSGERVQKLINGIIDEYWLNLLCELNLFGDG